LARIELSQSAFFHNLSLLSQKLGGKEKLAVVLKDNAYGHGLVQMARLSQEYGIQRAVVRTLFEAQQIKQYFRDIIILNIDENITPDPTYSYTINHLLQIDHIPQGTAVELKIDTGMHRNGIPANKLHEAVQRINEKKLHLKGVMTHFRSADEIGSELFWQLQQWKSIKQEVCTLCETLRIPLPLFHSANSAAALRLNHYEDDFARCGIAIYGYHHLPFVFQTPPLKPVLKLYAKKLSTLNLSKGARIGYGGTFTAPEDMSVSTYDIGYGDGFFRFNGEGEFYLGDKKVLGRISMDSLALEGEDEEVCILNDAKETARFFGTISYDVLVKLNPQIQRVVTH